MIIITDTNGTEHKYKGDIILNQGDVLLTICCNYSDPPGEDKLSWTGNVIDAFFPEDIKSIRGELD